MSHGRGRWCGWREHGGARRTKANRTAGRRLESLPHKTRPKDRSLVHKKSMTHQWSLSYWQAQLGGGESVRRQSYVTVDRFRTSYPHRLAA